MGLGVACDHDQVLAFERTFRGLFEETQEFVNCDRGIAPNLVDKTLEGTSSITENLSNAFDQERPLYGKRHLA